MLQLLLMKASTYHESRFACYGEHAALEAASGNACLCPRCGEWFHDDDRLPDSDLCPECRAMKDDDADEEEGQQ